MIISYKVDGESFNEIYDINFYHAIYGNDYLKSLPLVDSEESTGEYAYSGNESETFYYKSNRSKVFMDKREDLYDMNVNFSYKTIFSNIVIILAPQAARSVAMSADGDAKLSDYINFGSSDNGHTYKVKSATDYETFDNPSHRLWGSVKQTTNGTVPIKLPVYAEYSKKKWTGSYEYQYATSDTTKFTRTKDVTIDLTIYDKSILEKKLVEASAKIDKYDDDYYKVDTYNNYINAAKEVYKTRNTTQAKIDEAIKNLDTVINATPEEKEADYTKYNEIISKIVSLDSEFYKDNEEYKKLIEEYNNRNNYNNFKKSNQSTLDTYVSTLTSIYNNIPGNYTEVDFAIDRANKISNEIEVAGVKYNRYTDESYKALTDAVANVVTGKKVKDQSEIDSYAENINNAIKNLKDHAADYTKVDEAINKAKEKLGDKLVNEIEIDGVKYERYTSDSYKAVIDAINSVVKGKLVTEQEIVNKYAADINNAVKNLKDHAADYTKVDEAISAVPKNEIEINEVKYQKYTTASYKELTDLIDNIDRNKTILEQEEVNNYITLISKKEKELELCKADYSKLKNITSLIPYDFSIYNLESVEKLNTLLDKIKNLDSELKITSQDKLDSLIKEIDEVLSSLKLKDTSVTTKYDNKYDANYKPDKKVIKKNNKVSKSHIVSITVNGKELDLNSASITVENDVSKADIKVELSNSSDKYEIYGGNILIVGDNTITVYVYNDSDSYEYKFNIKREDEELTSVKKKTKTTINNIIKYKTNSKLIISASILGVLIIGTVCYLIIKKKNSEK